MIKILFVCHGNICRSPMAEYVMKDLVRQSGREDEFVIASAATQPGRTGQPGVSTGPTQTGGAWHPLRWTCGPADDPQGL